MQSYAQPTDHRVILIFRGASHGRAAFAMQRPSICSCSLRVDVSIYISNIQSLKRSCLLQSIEGSHVESWRPSRSCYIPANCSVDTIEFYAAWVLGIASKCWMVPRQKGHNGGASPRAHSWYAHGLHRLCWQPLMATSSPESMQMGHICKAHAPVSMLDHSRRHPCQQCRLTRHLQGPLR